MSNLNWSLHSQTAINVGCTDGGLKQYTSVFASNPPDYFDENSNFTLSNMGVAALLSLSLFRTSAVLCILLGPTLPLICCFFYA